ncbi:reverse transcriptase/maturase family protein [Patescibacteria group bacterium]|nr:reverse transcriptase/maturase family protein [Patescibacteria group bacterium]
MNTFFGRQLLYDLFQAYYDARKNKRSTINVLAFEIDYESKLFELYEEIKSEKYEISPSICFISFKPTKREIFAAGFRDRIVHHLIYNYINPYFERLFINDTYSCRVGRGTSCGIKRTDRFIRSCSDNYKKDCYILKLDIKGYFMSMDKHILYKKVEETLDRFRETTDFDVDFILRLIRKIIFHDHTKNCRTKGKREDWQGLPKSKSLFYAGENKGLPIGNLTSQLFGNIYLNDFDHFIKNKLFCRYYCRYVDDLVIVYQNKKSTRFLIPILRDYLKRNFLLEIHPNKIYLQHFSKGVAFLGTIIKPYRTYIRNQIKGNFYKKIQYWYKFLLEKRRKLSKDEFGKFLASVNSYLGMMKHYNTYKLRKKMLVKCLLPRFYPYIYTVGNYDKICSKT